MEGYGSGSVQNNEASGSRSTTLEETNCNKYGYDSLWCFRYEAEGWLQGEQSAGAATSGQEVSIIEIIVAKSVHDPARFFPDPDPTFQLVPDPDPVLDPT